MKKRKTLLSLKKIKIASINHTSTIRGGNTDNNESNYHYCSEIRSEDPAHCNIFTPDGSIPLTDTLNPTVYDSCKCYDIPTQTINSRTGTIDCL